MNYNPEKNHRRSIRLKGYGYSQPGVYSVTICSWNRECLFGDIDGGEMRLNEYGVVVEKFINKISDRFNHTELDCSIIMPNHVHVIIMVAGNVGAIHELPLRHEQALECRKQRRIMLLPKITGWLKNEFFKTNQSITKPSRSASLAT